MLHQFFWRARGLFPRFTLPRFTLGNSGHPLCMAPSRKPPSALRLQCNTNQIVLKYPNGSLVVIMLSTAAPQNLSVLQPSISVPKSAAMYQVESYQSLQSRLFLQPCLPFEYGYCNRHSLLRLRLNLKQPSRLVCATKR